MFGEDTKILEVLATANLQPKDEYIERRLLNTERDMVRYLEDIVKRAQDLLDQMNSGRPDLAARRIADSAGASGPIGSMYERLTATATEMNVLMAVGLKLVEAK
jgi:hypothetical protein